jgi:hypothetical protein
MRMRYQAADQRWRDDATKGRDDATKGRYSVAFKYINISYVNILRKSLRIYAIYKLMLCIMGIQSSTDII